MSECPNARGPFLFLLSFMMPYIWVVFLLLFHVQRTFAAVLTSTITVYFPLQHGNTRPATQNGVASIVGEANGITTYILTEPQSSQFIATFIEGQNVAVVILSSDPTLVASYSCDIQRPQAICMIALINPENGQIMVQTITENADSIALIEIGSPQPQPQPSSQPSQPSPTPPPTSNGGGGQTPPPPSSPTQGPSPSTTQMTGSSDPSPSSSPSTTSTSGPSDSHATSSSASGQPAPVLPSSPGDSPGDKGGSGSSPQDQGILPNAFSGESAMSGISSLSLSLVLALASAWIS